MGNILTVDKFKRQTISVYFRLLILAYSLFLLFMGNSCYKWFLNVPIFLLYLLLFSFCHGKDKLYSYSRLVLDYLFIGFIIYQYGYLDIYSFSLLFLPILNSQNHSGDKKSILLYIIPIATIVIIFEFRQIWILLPFSAFAIINHLSSRREQNIRLYEKLNTTVDSFFIEKENYKDSYKVYKECIPILNSPPLNLNIKEIYCFKITDEVISVINGSTFIWSFELDIDTMNSRKYKIGEAEIRINILKCINGNPIGMNLSLVYNLNNGNGTYIFVYLTEDLIPYHVIEAIINPLTVKLAKVFESKLHQRSIETQATEDLSAKMHYVNAAVHTMHFIRNKLGPVKNYLSMIDDYSASNPEKRKKIKPFLDREKDKVKSSLDLVLDRAVYILEKSNNPFIVSSLVPFKTKELFSRIREIWLEYNLGDNFIIDNFALSNRTNTVYYNKIGMDLVLTNWISNIYKYRNGNCGIEFRETASTLVVDFFNDFDEPQGDKNDFIKHFNSTNRLEINKRQTHGLLEVKDFLNQMSISHKLYSRENVVHFEIELVTYDSEN